MLTTRLTKAILKGVGALSLAAFSLTAFAQVDDFNARFSWKLKGEYGGFYVAQGRGFYKELGLNVHLGEGAGAQAALGALLQGQEDVVILPGIFALTAISKGMPIKLAALYIPKASTILLSYPDKAVRVPKDLEGKVMASAVGEIHTEYTDAFCSINDLDCSKIKRVRVNIQARIPQLIARQVDLAGVQANNDLPMVKKANPGIDFVEFNLADFGLVLPGLAVAVSDKALADVEKRENIVKFLQATAKGVDAMRTDANAAATDMLKLWAGGPDHDIVAEQIKVTADLTPQYDGKLAGWVDESAIEQALNILKMSGQLHSEKKLQEYYTNELLIEASKRAN